jgi:uncharacterized SAM-binding protein YcdF (DUF218 family)
VELRPWYHRAARLSVKVLAVPGLLMLLVAFTPVVNWWGSALQGRSLNSSGEVLIVLAGARYGDGIMGWDSYVRSIYAVRTFHSGEFRLVVVTGGSASGTPVSVSMGDWLRCHGVPAEKIFVERTSFSTRENALHTEELLKTLSGRKVLLTSDYHMFRARRVFARLGMQVLPLPVPDVEKRAGSRLSRWSAFVDLVLETCKIGYYWLRGWI